MSKQYKKDKSPDPIYLILDGFFKAIVWLIMLPFGGLKRGPGKDLLEAKRKEFVTHWQNFETMLGDAHQRRQAIMQADIMLDHALQLHGLPGNTLGERLKAATDKLSRTTLDTAWEAHKVRNQLAHELNRELSEAEARRVLDQFKTVLRTLGVL